MLTLTYFFSNLKMTLNLDKMVREREIEYETIAQANAAIETALTAWQADLGNPDLRLDFTLAVTCSDYLDAPITFILDPEVVDQEIAEVLVDEYGQRTPEEVRFTVPPTAKRIAAINSGSGIWTYFFAPGTTQMGFNVPEGVLRFDVRYLKSIQLQEQPISDNSE